MTHAFSLNDFPWLEYMVELTDHRDEIVAALAALVKDEGRMQLLNERHIADPVLVWSERNGLVLESELSHRGDDEYIISEWPDFYATWGGEPADHVADGLILEATSELN